MVIAQIHHRQWHWVDHVANVGVFIFLQFYWRMFERRLDWILIAMVGHVWIWSGRMKFASNSVIVTASVNLARF